MNLIPEGKNKIFKTEKPKIVWKTKIMNYKKLSESDDNFKNSFMSLETDLANTSPVDSLKNV